MDKEGMEGFGKIAGKVLTSPKFLEFISNANLGDLVNQALQMPGLKEKLLGTVTEMSRDLKERYEIKEWDWHADRENNALIIELGVDTTEMRKDFVGHFHNFLGDLRAKFGGGFDTFVKLYKINSIVCHEDGDKVKIVVSTPRVADLEAVILEIGTADVTFEGEEEKATE